MIPYEALQHAILAHDGEYDRCNLPAVLHPIEVAHKLRSLSPTDGHALQFLYDVKVVAYLHDVLEDTCYPISRLDRLTSGQLDALACMTRNENEPYNEYIERAGDNLISSYVKLADLHTNLNRQPGHSDTEARIIERQNKYLWAREHLWEVLGERWWPDDE